jgi:hypothetical protein
MELAAWYYRMDFPDEVKALLSITPAGNEAKI